MEKISETSDPDEDLRYATTFVKPLLAIVGAWPIPPTATFFSKALQKTENIFTYFMLLIMIGPGLSFMFLRPEADKVKLKLLGLIINWIMQFTKYTILLYRAKEIQFGLQMVRQDWIDATGEDRLIYYSKAKIGRKLMITITFTIYGGGICHRLFLPLLNGPIVTPDNITIRPMPCPSYFYIFDEQVSPNYEIVFAAQIIAGFVLFALISGPCGVCALLVLHTCSMLRILINKINALVEEKDANEVELQSRIKDIVEHQAKIKVFLKNIEKVTEYICLTEMLGGTLSLCPWLRMVLMEWEEGNTMTSLIYFTLFCSCTFCIFILCYIGQLLLDEHTDVGEASCTVNWYRLPTKHARSLVLIIAMSHYPMRLTAGKMMEMSLTSFTDLLKVAMGYFNILREAL